MPAPPEESEPAMVSAIGIVIAPLAGISAFLPGPCFVLARRAIGGKFACHNARFFACGHPHARIPNGYDALPRVKY